MKKVREYFPRFVTAYDIAPCCMPFTEHKYAYITPFIFCNKRVKMPLYIPHLHNISLNFNIGVDHVCLTAHPDLQAPSMAYD